MIQKKTGWEIRQAFKCLRDLDDIRAGLNVADAGEHHENSKNLRRKMLGSCCTTRLDNNIIDFVSLDESIITTVNIGNKISETLIHFDIAFDWNGTEADVITITGINN